MRTQQRGSALLLVVVVFAVLGALLGLSIQRGNALFTRIYREQLRDAAFYLAEGGLEYALHTIQYSREDFYGEEYLELEQGTCTISISRLTPSGTVEILSTGIAEAPSPRWSQAEKTLRVRLQYFQDDPETPIRIISREEL